MKRIGDQALPFRLPALGDDGFALTRSGACSVCMVDERCFRPERREHFWSTRVAGFDFMSFTVSVLEEWT